MADLSKRTLVRDVELPSRGLLYGDSLPGGLVKVAAMTTREEKLLASSGGNAVQKINQLVEQCVDLKGFPMGDLLWADRNFLLIQVRVLSYGDSYEFLVTCDECSQQFRHSVLFSELPARKLPDGFGEPFEVTLPITKARLGLRLLRIKDMVTILRYADQAAKKGGPREAGILEGDPAYTFNLAMHIRTFNGKPIEPLQARDFIETPLEAPDSAALRQAIDDNGCGYLLEADALCIICGGVNEAETVPFTGEFFRPRVHRLVRPDPGA